jgi:hypothetical protein
MSGRQYDLSFDAQIADILKRLHVLETAGPYDSQINTLNTGLATTNTGLATTNTTIANLAGIQSYTPVWNSTGTAPNIGNGTIKGKYVQIGKLVVAWISQAHGSTTTYGGGVGSSYTWTLPTVAHNANSVPEMQGTWIGAPTAGAVFGGVTDVDTAFGASLGRCWIQVTGAALNTYGGVNLLNAVIPAAWASGGSMRMTFIYETS